MFGYIKSETINKPLPPLSESDVKRFWGKVAITANQNKCWEWLGSKRGKGYGQFSVNYNKKPMNLIATRASFLINKNVDPVSSFVLHSCDNPSCVNPHHLSLGLHKKNAEEMMERGLGKEQFENGEKHKMSKLTEKQVLEIRERFLLGEKQFALAKIYQVDQAQISNVIKRKYWKHI